MPSISYDSLSFFHDGARAGVRRFPIVGAALDPALVDPARWADRLAELRHAGFNTVVARVPWSLHEAIPDRFEFSGSLDVRRFVAAAGAAGLKVVLRIGPCVGGTFAAGGVPSWIGQFAADRIREANPGFMQRVARFWRRVAQETADLQATRNGGGAERPIVAIGLEDHWHSLDADVGAAYFGELVRFVREFGFDVPLISANNCWYMHEGVVDTWCRPSDAPAERMDEMRQVQPDAPAMAIVAWDEGALALASRVMARSEFVLEVGGCRHRGATGARGLAERESRELFDLRRVLVFASSFGESLSGMTSDELAQHIELRRRADGRPEFHVKAHAKGLALGAARLSRSTASLVAFSGDMLVVAGRPRSRIEVRIDGSSVTMSVPADGALPKCTRVRGLRVVAVPDALADGIAIVHGGGGADGFEFVDRNGGVLVTVGQDGAIRRRKPGSGEASTKAVRPKAIRLGAVEALVEPGYRDGTHARFASIDGPNTLGAFGASEQTAYYRARFKQAGKSKRIYALASSCAVDGALAVDGAQRADGGAPIVEIAASGAHAIVAEVRNDGVPSEGRATGAATGVFGPLVEVVPLKGVKVDAVPQPSRDPTTAGRFICGFDLADHADAKTVRWRFPTRKEDVVLVLPASAADALAAGGHVFRLNGEFLPCARAGVGGAMMLLLPAAKLSPMRPKQLKKGEKPPKARNAVLEPGDNELIYDGAPHASVKDVRLFAVKAAVPTDWAFARVSPPASWASAKPVAKAALAKRSGVPTWFRTSFHLDAPRALALRAVFVADARATVLVNGATTLVHDGASGAAIGKGKSAKRARTAHVPAHETRRGANDVLIFSPDGRMPECTVA